ncbi:MAG: hypothetical protein WEA24_01340 [Gemmatimonadota bacterium]
MHFRYVCAGVLVSSAMAVGAPNTARAQDPGDECLDCHEYKNEFMDRTVHAFDGQGVPYTCNDSAGGHATCHSSEYPSYCHSNGTHMACEPTEAEEEFLLAFADGDMIRAVEVLKTYRANLRVSEGALDVTSCEGTPLHTYALPPVVADALDAALMRRAEPVPMK